MIYYIDAQFITKLHWLSLNMTCFVNYRCWYVPTAECIHIMNGHTAAVNAVAVTEDGNKTVSASSDATVKVWLVQNDDGIEEVTDKGQDNSPPSNETDEIKIGPLTESVKVTISGTLGHDETKAVLYEHSQNGLIWCTNLALMLS